MSFLKKVASATAASAKNKARAASTKKGYRDPRTGQVHMTRSQERKQEERRNKCRHKYGSISTEYFRCSKGEIDFGGKKRSRRRSRRRNSKKSVRRSHKRTRKRTHKRTRKRTKKRSRKRTKKR
jgi:hypothetical protein